jgi:hypothetical protein
MKMIPSPVSTMIVWASPIQPASEATDLGIKRMYQGLPKVTFDAVHVARRIGQIGQSRPRIALEERKIAKSDRKKAYRSGFGQFLGHEMDGRSARTAKIMPRDDQNAIRQLLVLRLNQNSRTDNYHADIMQTNHVLIIVDYNHL